MRSIAAVGIHDNLAASETGITVRTAGHETTGGIDVILRVVIHQIAGHSVSDNVFANLGAQLIVFNFGRVLRRNHDCINPEGASVAVLNRDLRLSVGTKIRKFFIFTKFCQIILT